MDAPVYLLKTARLGLRRWKDSDLEPFARMNQDPAVREFFPGLMSFEQAADMVTRLEHHFDQYGYGFYAIDLLSTGEFIGFTGLSHPSFESWFTPCVEIGWRLKREAWGCGYATEAAAECLVHGLGELGLEKIYAFAVVGNIRSERVMLKIGMKKVGEFDHPNLEEGSWLRKHVLYVRDHL